VREAKPGRELGFAGWTLIALGLVCLGVLTTGVVLDARRTH